jgi:biotin carboxyl carrier protein
VTIDPLAVLAHGKSKGPAAQRVSSPPPARGSIEAPPGTIAVCAPMQGTIVSFEAEVGAELVSGEPLLVMEAMKMQHVIAAPEPGIVRGFAGQPGDAVYEGNALAFLEPARIEREAAGQDAEQALDHIRADLAEVIARHAFGDDDKRPDVVEKRHTLGFRTARENLDDLCDEGSFVEYGALVIAAQRRRRSEQELIERFRESSRGYKFLTKALFRLAHYTCCLENSMTMRFQASGCSQ